MLYEAGAHTATAKDIIVYLQYSYVIDFLPCVLQVPLFENTEIGFTKLLALSIKPVLFLKNEYIVRKGDIGSEVGLELRLQHILGVFRAVLYNAMQVCLCVGQVWFDHLLYIPVDVLYQSWHSWSCLWGWQCRICLNDRRKVLWGDQSNVQCTQDSFNQVDMHTYV